MGAAGTIIICKNGHQCLFIEEHMDILWWEEIGFPREEKAKKANCPVCGTDVKYQFAHYGDMNDCIWFPNDPEYPNGAPLHFIEAENRWTLENVKHLEEHLVKT